jgi:tetratricopeptide (TPR) repeat protein
MISARLSGWLVLAPIVFATGAAIVASTRWTHPVAAGDAALARGDWEAAQAAYAEAESRFDRMPMARRILVRDYARAVAAQLAIAYRRHRYDEVIEKAVQAPPLAAPHFWAGLAYFAKSRGDEAVTVKMEDRSGWLMRAEEELRIAVQDDPDDWSTKYDFEIATRLAAALRKQPQPPPDQLAPLLRPEPRAGTRPPRRVG